MTTAVARRTALIVAVGAVLLLASACSSGEGSPDAGDSTSSTAAPTTVPPPTPDDVAVPDATDAAIDSIDVDALLRSDGLVILNVLPSFPDRRDMTFPLGMADHDLVFTEAGNRDETRDRVGFTGCTPGGCSSPSSPIPPGWRPGTPTCSIKAHI